LYTVEFLAGNFLFTYSDIFAVQPQHTAKNRIVEISDSGIAMKTSLCICEKHIAKRILSYLLCFLKF